MIIDGLDGKTIDNVGMMRRAIQQSRRSRTVDKSAFPVSSGGLLHAPHPGNTGRSPSSGGGQVNLGSPPIGELIRLSVSGHIGNSGEDILFSSIAYRNGFKAVEIPNAEILLPHKAIYGIEGELAWTDGYTGGGTVTLVINGVDYYTLPGFTGAWTRFEIATEFDAEKGSRLSIRVDHTDTAADHNLEGTLVIATKEPLKELVDFEPVCTWVVQEEPATLLGFDANGRLVETVGISSGFAGGVWGLAYDGTGYWVSDQFDGSLIKFSAAGAVLATISDPPGVPAGPVAYLAGSLWVANPFAATVYEVDPSDGTILSSFAGPNAGHWGITTDGANLFLGREETVWKVSTTGTLLDTITVAVAASELSIYGLGWLNGSLIVTDSDGDGGRNVLVVNPADGSVTETWSDPATGTNYVMSGAAASEECEVETGLWVHSFPEKEIHLVDIDTMTIVRTIPSPIEGDDCQDMSYYAGSLYLSDADVAKFWQIDPADGTVIDSITATPLGFPAYYFYGIERVAEGFWTHDWVDVPGETVLFQWESGAPPTEVNRVHTVEMSYTHLTQTWDGTYVWVGMFSDGKLVRVNPADGTWSTLSWTGDNAGVWDYYTTTFDGTDLLSLGVISLGKELFRITLPGLVSTSLGDLPAGVGIDPYAIAWMDGS